MSISEQSHRRGHEKCSMCVSTYSGWLITGAKRSFNFSIEKLNSKLDDLLGHLKYAAEVNVAFSFVIKNIEDSCCRFVFAQGKNSLLEKYKLLITGDDLKHVRAMIAARNIITACTHGMLDTK